MRFAGVDAVGKAAGRAERQPEEFELVGRSAGTFAEQFQALGPHFGVLLVGHQLDAVVERADRRHQVMAQARAEQAGEIDGVHARLMRHPL